MHEEANENAEGLEVFSCLLQEPSISLPTLTNPYPARKHRV